MWVSKVTSIAGACVLGAGFFVGGTVISPPSLMRVALADDTENPVAAPGGTTAVESVPAPADVAAAALLPGMDPGSLTQNPDGSLVYHGTTPAGVETPGWVTIAAPNGLIEMVRGPVAPAPATATAPAAAGPAQSPTAEPYQAEGTVSSPDEKVPGTVVTSPEGTVWLPEGMASSPGIFVPQP